MGLGDHEKLDILKTFASSGFFGGADVQKAEEYFNAKIAWTCRISWTRRAPPMMMLTIIAYYQTCARKIRPMPSSEDFGYLSLFILAILGSAIGNYISATI